MNSLPQWLIDGYRQFKNGDYQAEVEKYQRLATEGQAPKVMIVGCSDSRVDPNAIFSADPGELFVVRNVANLVPPFERGGGMHGVSAALEFGVEHLKVEHLIVLGHTGCGGIQAMLDPNTKFRDDMVFISNWVSMMADARDDVITELGEASIIEQMEALQQRSIMGSLENLRSFPFVSNGEAAGTLTLHGAVFDVGSGSLFSLDPATNSFSKIESANS